MGKAKEIGIIAALGIAIVVAFFYLDVENSLFGKLIDPIQPLDFDEVHPRSIVKNAVPIFLLEQNGDTCKVHSEKFTLITNHTYFVRSQELIDNLQYDHNDKTLILPCDEIPEEKSRLEVWYVIPESDTHATKYDFWVEPWEETVMPTIDNLNP
jgi:hypothetical protein